MNPFFKVCETKAIKIVLAIVEQITKNTGKINSFFSNNAILICLLKYILI